MAGRRIAYYIWRFPTLSETFIQRELRGLVAAGVDVIVIADAAGDQRGGEGPTAMPPIRLLLPISIPRLVADLVTTVLRRPLQAVALLIHTLRSQYQDGTSLADDIRVWLKAVHLAATLRRSGVDHVHAPWGDANAFIAMLAARLAPVTFSVQFRAHDLHRTTSSFLIAEKIRNARFVITNTEFNLDVLARLADPGDRPKLHRIYNGLELKHLPPVPQRRSGVREVRLLTVARLIEQKGLPYLFEACRLLLDRGYAIQCRVIGAPELPRYAGDLAEIQAAHRRWRLDAHVELTGARPFGEVAVAYTEADIFVLPCVIARDGSTDITPNSVLEAMASGLPVVSTTTTALPELVIDGATGLLVAPRDAVSLAAAIARLIDDPALRTRLGAAGRHHVEQRFDIERNIQAYVALFSSLS